MTAMISNILGKSIVIPRTISYALGATAAHKLACFGYRSVSYIATSCTNSQIPKTINSKANAFGFNVYSKEDSKNSKVDLLKQVVVIGIIACLLHDITFSIQGKAPKIYNAMLSLTPVRVLETSCLDSIKETIRSFSPRKLSLPV